MNELGFPILSLMMAVPMAGALLCLFASAPQARQVALVATLADLVLGLLLWLNFDQSAGHAQWQFQEYAPVLRPLRLGDGDRRHRAHPICVFLMPICASWDSIEKRVGEYMIAFLCWKR
jgi:NADH-quinone oxidoreductase subunit M